MALTGQSIRDALKGLLGAQDATDKTRTDIFFRSYEHCFVQDAATAGTAVTTSTMYVNRTGYTQRILSAYVTAPITVAADNTDYVTFTVQTADGAGGSGATAFSGDTRAASLNALAAAIPEALTATAANVVVPVGGVVTIAVAKTGSGKAIVAATSYCHIQIELEQLG